ncbi:peptidoglycan DD-metalloendopeptidase family protein [Pannus brasiliensis CCIBt3594]|uniref:Peptidoglycan DD-metalloendopeptidase family protein n=1 Tax=Pannus brasiliensis CCIBt3594 TaxID=1427578 RepID=A0AAW9QQE1_9CHRO
MLSKQYPKLAEVAEGNTTTNIEETEDRALIAELQRLLNSKGFNAGQIDGFAGTKTLAALEKAKDHLHLQFPELLGKTTIEKLFEMHPIRGYVQPTRGIGRLSSPFGYRIHPIRKTRAFHRGIDIAADRGTPIYAIAPGRVSVVESGCKGENNSCGGGFGNHIRILHLDNPSFSESLYAHLQSANVRNGQIVEAGEVIGTMGSSGRSTGPHLHFEIWRNGQAINPEDVMSVV